MAICKSMRSWEVKRACPDRHLAGGGPVGYDAWVIAPFGGLSSGWGYFLAVGGLQSGKKVLATIFDVCPLVALLDGRKYGRLSGGTHGSAGTLPHGYPDITPRDANRSMKS
jgi:hypothetical protein